MDRRGTYPLSEAALRAILSPTGGRANSQWVAFAAALLAYSETSGSAACHAEVTRAFWVTPGQTCCWSDAHQHRISAGGLPLVRRFAETFGPYDLIVAPSGSCVGSVRHQHAMVARRAGTVRHPCRGGGGSSRTLSRSYVAVFCADSAARDPKHQAQQYLSVSA